METLSWISWIIGIAGIVCLIVFVIAILYPEVVLFEELILQRKSTFLLFDVDNPGKVHFFLDMQPEICVPVEDTGKNLIEFLMNSDSKKFRGEGTRSEKWVVEPIKTEEVIRYQLNVKGWYREYIRHRTGRVFVGFYPFRKIPAKPIFKLKRLPAVTKEGEWFEHIPSVTNHIRIRPFEWYFQVKEAEVAGLIPTNVYGVILAEVINPYDAWYGVDAWDSQLSNAVVSTTRDIIREWPVEFVLASNVGDQEKTQGGNGKRLEAELISRFDRLFPKGLIFGIKIKMVQIFEVKPVLSEKELQKARAEFYARRQGDAYKVEQAARAIADAGYLQKMSERLSVDPNGLFVYDQDTRRIMAKESQSTIIFADSGVSPVEKALMLTADRLRKGTEIKEGDAS